MTDDRSEQAGMHAGDVDVLIIGAGPTGLTLAIELARREVRFLLIDRDPARATSSRALGTQARTVEVFRLMGIPESALTPAARPRALRFAEGSRTLARIPFGERPGDPLLISMNEADTERVLEERLVELGGRIVQSAEFLRFRIEGETVVSTVQGPAGAWEVRSRFLVGADGAHSAVRHGAGIGFAGAAYPERFLLADLDLDWDLPHDEAHVWIGNEGLAAVIPLPGERRYRLIVPLSPGESQVEFPGESAIADRAEEALRQRTGLRLHRIGDPIWASSFRISRRQAERYRQGPVFLAGDAAHVHSPVGGQGMNMGIQDAFNLGWKLALAVGNEAAPGLLDTYEAERHPVARAVLQGTHLGTRLVLARNPLLEALREHALPALANIPPVRRALIATISQVRVNYRGAFLAVDADEGHVRHGAWRRDHAGLHAGDRVPDAPLSVLPGGEPIALFDLIACGWLLMLLAGASPTSERIATLASRAAETGRMVGEAVRPILVLHDPRDVAHDMLVVLDASGEMARRFAGREGLVALIRPDGYLGYRGTPDQDGALASYLARVFALRMPGIGQGT